MSPRNFFAELNGRNADSSQFASDKMLCRLQRDNHK